MKNTLLIRTEMVRVEPIGRAVRDHAILSVLVGDETAAMLARPVISSDGKVIDWYAPGLVRAVRLVDLPEEQQIAPRQRVARLQTDLNALADQLKDRDSADMLRDVPSLPDETHIFVVDGLPILTAWSCVRVDGGRYRAGFAVLAEPPGPLASVDNATEQSPRETPPRAERSAIIAGPGPVERNRRRLMPWWLWLLWLLFVLLIVAILALLLRACALAPYVGWLGLGNYCAQERQSGSDVSQLQLIAVDLEEQLRRSALDCLPSAPLPGTQAAQGEPAHDAVAQANERTDDLQRGQLEIALIWQTEDDLDLRINFNCPGLGPRSIGYRNKGQTICGGTLDQDANVTNVSTSPAEHVVWVDGQTIPPGEMNIIVDYYKDNGPPSPQVPYQIVIQRDGQEPEIVNGALTPRASQVVTSLQN